MQPGVNPLAAAETGSGQASRGETTFPVSYSQQRLWLLDQILPSRAVYNVGQTVRMLGRLDVAALERALVEVVRRQESLRTRFALSGEAPVQIVAPELAVRLDVEVVDGATHTDRAAQALRLAQAEAQKDFDLRTGPLWRARLLRLGSEEHWLQITLHHIITDGWSSGILIRELSQLYVAYSNGVAPLLPALPVQYADFAVWQREWMQGEVLTRQLAYWKKALAEVPVLELGPALGHDAQAGGDDHEPDGHVDEEDRGPAELLGEQAAQQHPGSAADAAHGAPGGQRAVARAPLGERGREDRQCGRGDDRRAEALQRASAVQRGLRVGHGAQDRGQREQPGAGQEHAPAPEQVGRAAAEHEEAGERQRVRVDDPLQSRGRISEVMPDRRQRDVHDRDVEHHHQLREADDEQKQVAANWRG